MKAKALRFRIILLLLTAYFVYQGNTNKLFAFETTDTQVVYPSYCTICAISLVSFDSFSELPSDQQKTVIKKEEIKYLEIIHRAADKHEVDPAIIKSIIMAESGYNHMAVSKSGARGLMQLMPTTAKALGVDDIFNPKQNINAGVKYFKQKLNQFNGDIRLALAAYNAGSGNVKKYKGVPPFRATKIYIKKVLKYHKQYQKHMLENG